MAKAKTQSKPRRRLSTVHRHAAGIDIGATFHVVAVPPDSDPESCRTFRSFTGDLHRLADWLEAVGITTVAMESTGVYWIPVFEILEGRGSRPYWSTHGMPRTFRAARPTSMMPSGCSSSIHMDSCGEAFDPENRSPRCGPICATVSGWSSIRRRTSSTCRRL